MNPGLEKATDREAAEYFLEEINKLCQICQIPTLEEYGVDQRRFEQSIDKMSQDALASGSPQKSRASISKEEVMEIYRKLWK